MRVEPLPVAATESSVAGAALSAASLAGASFASAVTLVWPGAFPDIPDEPFNGVLAEARGWSAVTLGLAVPLGVWAWTTHSLRARLARAGAMAYLVYTYLEFAAGPPFTALYLVYVATFACALAALIIAVADLDLAALPAAFGDRAPRVALAGFGLAIAGGLSLAWGRDVMGRLLAGETGWLHGSAAVRHVVEALDLGLQVPLGLAAGWLLLARRPAGFVLGAILAVMGVCMGWALVAMVAASALASGDGLLAVAPFALLPLAAVPIAIRFFGAVEETP